MSALLNLPTELFGEIFNYVVTDVCVLDLLRLRPFCRFFAETFTYEILANVSIRTLGPYYHRCPYCAGRGQLSDFLRPNLGTALSYRIQQRQTEYPELQLLIKSVADKLMSFDNATSGEMYQNTKMLTYIHNLCSTIAAAQSSTLGLLFTPNYILHDPTLYHHGRLRLTDDEYLAAAAAVGNIAASQYFLPRCKQVLIRSLRGGFGNAIVNAAMNNHTEIVDLLLAHVRAKVAAVSPGTKTRKLLNPVELAVDAAMANQNQVCAITLIKYVHAHGGNAKNIEEYAGKAARTGCPEVIEFVLEDLLRSNINFHDVFLQARKHGRSAVVRYLLAIKVVDLKAPRSRTVSNPKHKVFTPMRVARTFGYLALANWLDKYAAKTA